MIRALLIIVSLGLFFITYWRGFSPVQANQSETLQARPASAFVNSLGVNIHAGWVKNNSNLFAQQLAYVGFHHVRDSIIGAKSGNYAARLALFARQNIDWDLIMPGDPAPYTSWILQNNRYLTDFEGPNEPDLALPIFNGQQGIPAAVAIQQALAHLILSRAELHHLKLVDYALSYAHLYTAPINRIDDADYRNLHVYAPNGLPPRAILQQAIDYIGPGKPVYMTETGYTDVEYNLISAKGYHEGVDEIVQAKYLLDSVFDNFSFSVTRTYLYDLRDDGNDPENTNKEYHYGLFRYDGSPKPSAIAFHNLIKILNVPPAGQNPPPIHVVVASSGNGAPVYSLLLKTPGGYALVCWAEPRLWSAECHCALPANDTTAKIDFGNAIVSATLFDPLLSSQPLSTQTAKSMIVKVLDHPIILRLQMKTPV